MCVGLRVQINCNQQQWRPFATSRQKRAQEQQQQDGTANSQESERGESSIPRMRDQIAHPSSRPKSLIRTDFGLGGQQLFLPSGYELPSSDPSATNFSYIDYKELYDPKVHLPSAPQDWSDYEPATPLWEELAAQIGVLGRPMTVAEFMQQALLHPKYGYYSQPSREKLKEGIDDDDLFNDSDNEDDNLSSSENPIFGPRGDFVTAPEICQVFGESIQVWMITQWKEMGKPNAYQLVEFGPGRGTLMADMVSFALTHSDTVQEYGKALKVIHFIEPSHLLRDQQQASLEAQLSEYVNWEFHNPAVTDKKEESCAVSASTKPTIRVYWHDSFASVSTMIIRQKQQSMEKKDLLQHSLDSNYDEKDISSMPLFVVCQEFFDALPVHGK
jgi:hypothetical protein